MFYVLSGVTWNEYIRVIFLGSVDRLVWTAMHDIFLLLQPWIYACTYVHVRILQTKYYHSYDPGYLII